MDKKSLISYESIQNPAPLLLMILPTSAFLFVIARKQCDSKKDYKAFLVEIKTSQSNMSLSKR